MYVRKAKTMDKNTMQAENSNKANLLYALIGLIETKYSDIRKLTNLNWNLLNTIKHEKISINFPSIFYFSPSNVF